MTPTEAGLESEWTCVQVHSLPQHLCHCMCAKGEMDRGLVVSTTTLFQTCRVYKCRSETISENVSHSQFVLASGRGGGGGGNMEEKGFTFLEIYQTFHPKYTALMSL